MTLLGVTGGVGMGKSTAARLLSGWGHRVVDTDDVAREVVRPGEPALAEVREAFGPGSLLPDGTLDRGWLAGRVFAEAGARARLEAILHPRIRAAWKARVAGWRSEGCRLGAVIIPLLFETGAEGEFDATVCVACGAASQRVRLRERGWTEEHLERRVAAQMPVEEKMRRSDFVLWTEPPVAEHEAQWRRVLATLGVTG